MKSVNLQNFISDLARYFLNVLIRTILLRYSKCYNFLLLCGKTFRFQFQPVHLQVWSIWRRYTIDSSQLWGRISQSPLFERPSLDITRALSKITYLLISTWSFLYSIIRPWYSDNCKLWKSKIPWRVLSHSSSNWLLWQAWKPTWNISVSWCIESFGKRNPKSNSKYFLS